MMNDRVVRMTMFRKYAEYWSERDIDQNQRQNDESKNKTESNIAKWAKKLFTTAQSASSNEIFDVSVVVAIMCNTFMCQSQDMV